MVSIFVITGQFCQLFYFRPGRLEVSFRNVVNWGHFTG